MKKQILCRNKGYTLVEMMVALVLTSIATIGVYRGYTSFSTAYAVQEQLIEMNQNLRIAVQKMVTDIRHAGYTQASGAGFVTINADEISFTKLNDVTDTLETITYEHDAGNRELDRRVNGGAAVSVIENVDALDFIYLDANKAVTGDTNNIRYVQISIVVRTTNEDYSFTDTVPYENQAGTTILVAQNDNFHRRLLTSEVKCRNMSF